jgi:hypothetical protein
MNVQPFVIADGRYRCDGGNESVLGRGSFAYVYLGYEVQTRKKVTSLTH